MNGLPKDSLQELTLGRTEVQIKGTPERTPPMSSTPRISIDGEWTKVDKFPGECPRCHKAIVPIDRAGGIERNDHPHVWVQVPMLCPACRWLFLATYEYELGFPHRDFPVLQKMEPWLATAQKFGPVEHLSPDFVMIFNQAAAAEAYGLNQIAGLAYRKSLEFLIKDYCISLQPQDAEAIKSSTLGSVIKERLTDRRVRMAAEKVAWLGNDEAHYVRKWESHDVQDLKALLRIAVNGISEDLEFDSMMKTFEKKAND